MDFLNHFKSVKKMEKNLYEDLELAWAEYEYICSIIKTRIRDILKEDEEIFMDNEISVDINDASIIISLKSCVSIYTISRIEAFLGVSGKVYSTGSKKHSKIKMIFEKEKLKIEDEK